MQRTSGRVVEATAVGPIRVADALGWTSSALGAPMTIAPRRSCGPSVKDDRKAVLWTAGSACASTRRDRERDRQPAAADRDVVAGRGRHDGPGAAGGGMGHARSASAGRRRRPGAASKWILGRAAVLDRKEGRAAGRHVAGGRPVEQVDVAEDASAAVEEQHRWAGRRAVLGVPAHLDLLALLGGAFGYPQPIQASSRRNRASSDGCYDALGSSDLRPFRPRRRTPLLRLTLVPAVTATEREPISPPTQRDPRALSPA
jgi:hypothetical protein